MAKSYHFELFIIALEEKKTVTQKIFFLYVTDS